MQIKPTPLRCAAYAERYLVFLRQRARVAALIKSDGVSSAEEEARSKAEAAIHALAKAENELEAVQSKTSSSSSGRNRPRHSPVEIANDECLKARRDVDKTDLAFKDAVMAHREAIGSLEEAIGDKSISQRTGGKYASTHELVKAFENGDNLASYWWLSSIQKLACGVSSIINCLSPEIFIIGGGIADAGESLFDPLREFVSLYEWRPGNHNVPIVKAARGSFAGAIGAALFAMKI